MVNQNASESSDDRSRYMPRIGFELPSRAAPAPTGAAIPKPPQPGTRKPPAQPVTLYRAPNRRLSFWRLNSSWLAPVVLILLGLTIFSSRLLWLGGLEYFLLAQSGLAILLLYRAVIGVFVCLVGMKLMGEDLGPIPTFLLQVVATTTFAGALGFAVPHIGIWVLEPLFLCALLTWLLEVRPGVGALLAATTWIVTWGLVFLLLARVFGLLLAN